MCKFEKIVSKILGNSSENCQDFLKSFMGKNKFKKKT